MANSCTASGEVTEKHTEVATMVTQDVDKGTPSVFRTENPLTGEVERYFSVLDDSELKTVLATAQAGFEAWSKRSVAERAAVVERVAAVLETRRGELARLAAKEMGKALGQAESEVDFCVSILRYYAAEGERLLADTTLKEGPGFKAVLQTAPLGPVLGIMPWNFPYYQVMRFAAPNLVLGNAVLVKHAVICPQVALAIEVAMSEGGVPDGVYQNLFVTHEQVETVIADPRVCGVSLTGSERAGARVAEIAGRHLKKVVLELGGSDAHMYVSANDVREAARGALRKRMINGGQVCTSNKRILVAQHMYDEFLAELVTAAAELTPGDPLAPEASAYYPLSSVAAADEVAAQIQRAVDQGAALHIGGKRLDRPGAWVEPAVLTGITPEMDAYTEEIFGPVLMVYPIRDADEGVEIANSSPYGLGGAVFATDEAEAVRIAGQLNTGMVNINATDTGGPDLPFGGVKRSGFGRELGDLGIYEFANRKLLSVKTAAA
jgi:succinate-semialdehyde dehydrogenase/glutarate-semialdehyde dehydrogenase